MMRFENKVAIVTGGGDGIGYGITERLSSEGANVMVVDFNSEIGSQSVSEIVDSILKLKEVGYNGFLIGEKFMKTNNPMESAYDFIKKIENEI